MSKIVQVTTATTPMQLNKECILKSIITQNTGSDLALQLFEQVPGPLDFKKLDIVIDANIQGYMVQIPLWDLKFNGDIRFGISNGSAFIIYEEVDQNTKGSDIVQLQVVAGQMISGDPGILKGIILQGSGSDTQVRLWDCDGTGTRPTFGKKKLLDLKIDATFQGYCVPMPLFDLEFDIGIYGIIDNGDAFLIYQQ